MHDAAFLHIKQALVNLNVLKEPRYEQPFIVQSDWSIEGMGAMLMQEYNIYKDSSGHWQLDIDPQQNVSMDKAPELLEVGAAFVGAIIKEPENVEATAQQYLKLDMSVGPLLRRFEGDELEPLLRFILFLEQPELQATCKKMHKFSLYMIKDGELCYVQDSKVNRVLPCKEARQFAQLVHSCSHAGIATMINIIRLQEGITWPLMWQGL
ncbi:hypothetical protein [Sporisorium scitamineum]|uniref:Reverse transcriptase/retrotransposon-derived protein RNase H-like domain-containing protein n=1 Tax=Sporisorium scitamineum TaxID=49012 RepID=A0A0F7RT49_9BASI|nr:hypothetical protein [Sporisorium scitamineum]